MRVLAVLSLLATGARALLSWGQNCSYAESVLTTTATIPRLSTITLATVPSGLRGVFIQVDSGADMDMSLLDASGDTTYLEYGDEYDGGGTHWCVDCAGATNWTQDGMSMTACVDACAATASFTNQAGTSFAIAGDDSYSSEWVFVEAVAERLVVQVSSGSKTSVATINWAWDCAAGCNCSAAPPPTARPTAAPTLSRPPSAAPSAPPSSAALPNSHSSAS